MFELIKNILIKRLNRKKQEVTRLRWQQTELQRQLDTLKQQKSEK